MQTDAVWSCYGRPLERSASWSQKVLGRYQGAGGGQGQGFSLAKWRVRETGDGECCTTTWAYLAPLNCTVNDGLNSVFYITRLLTTIQTSCKRKPTATARVPLRPAGSAVVLLRWNHSDWRWDSLRVPPCTHSPALLDPAPRLSASSLWRDQWRSRQQAWWIFPLRSHPRGLLLPSLGIRYQPPWSCRCLPHPLAQLPSSLDYQLPGRGRTGPPLDHSASHSVLLGWLGPWLIVGEKSETEGAQSCPTLCDPMDWSLPGSSVHGSFQARALKCVAISFSRGSFQLWDRTEVSCIAGRCFTF